MNDNDRLHSYLADRAAAITLPPADLGATTRRGARRRTRRRAALAGVAVVAVTATTVSVFDRGESGTAIDSGLAAPSAVPSSFDWTVVSPTAGLGVSSTTAIADGVAYSLSTSPGSIEDPAAHEPRVYRSEDGSGWAEVQLPNGLRPASLAGYGDTLYAIGTAPAGGASELVMAASRDGAASWTTVTLPAELAELQARHPDEISFSQMTIAAKDATHLVASVVVTANPRLDRIIPDLGEDVSIQYTEDGVVTRAIDPPVEAPATSTTGDAASGDEPLSMELPADGGGEIVGTYTWDELGVAPEVRDLIEGRTYTYVSDDGATFEPVSLPTGLDGWGGPLLATADGYVLFSSPDLKAATATHVLRSVDGHTWTESGSIPALPIAAGIVNGRPAVSVLDRGVGLAVLVAQPDGTWAPLDLLAAVGDQTETVMVADVAFGPLGVAALIQRDAPAAAGPDAVPTPYAIAHSTDGTTVSAVPLADHFDAPQAPMGLTVTADAIVARFDEEQGDSQAAPVQHALVGTPR